MAPGLIVGVVLVFLGGLLALHALPLRGCAYRLAWMFYGGLLMLAVLFLITGRVLM